jgi:PEP-CTERM motif-containing protein
MNTQRTIGISGAVISVTLLSVFAGQAGAFNPQPEPPGDLWKVEGFIDLWTQVIDPTTEEMPFGIDQDIVGDSIVDFESEVIARFSAPITGGDQPADGVYDAVFEYFQVRIGNTTWDQTMPGSIQFKLTDGVVTGWSGIYTDTMPEHPDLSFMFPASPGTWEALDERNDVNLGVVKGTYSLRDGTVPEPATGLLLMLGMAAMLLRRHSPA